MIINSEIPWEIPKSGKIFETIIILGVFFFIAYMASFILLLPTSHVLFVPKGVELEYSGMEILEIALWGGSCGFPIFFLPFCT